MNTNAIETKRQHYVPKTYLNYFSSKRGKEYYINVLPKNCTNITEVKELNVRNVCIENNIYTLPFEKVNDKMLIEHFFSNKIESNYNNTYNLLTNSNKKHISDEERALVITTVVTMYFRTAYWKNTINSFKSEIFEKAYYLCKQQNQDYFYYGENKISFSEKTLEEIQKEYKIKENTSFLITQLNAMSILFDIRFMKDDICLFKIDNDEEFITSDNPVIAFNKGVIIPINSENTMFLPIDSKHILCLIPNDNSLGRNSVFRRNIVDKREVEVYNLMQRQSSERFLLGSKSSLTKMINFTNQVIT